MSRQLVLGSRHPFLSCSPTSMSGTTLPCPWCCALSLYSCSHMATSLMLAHGSATYPSPARPEPICPSRYVAAHEEVTKRRQGHEATHPQQQILASQEATFPSARARPLRHINMVLADLNFSPREEEGIIPEREGNI
jgi:hypothetical protein